MVIISKSSLNQFIIQHHASKDRLLDWYLKTKESDWASLSDVKNVFRTVDYVGDDLYVFNIGGNNFRLVARIIFPIRTVFIRFIGSHAEYDKINLSNL